MLLQKKNRYLKGKIDKERYMKEMFNVHKFLFEYPELIKSSPVQKIEITGKDLLFTIRSGKKNIKILADKRDVYSIPLTYLNISKISERDNDETRMILNIIKSGDVIFDIGANIGWYTLLVLLNRKRAIVYSFEPIKSSYKLMIKNLLLNNQKTDKAHDFGFSDENKKVKFYFDIECATASSMANLRKAKATINEECEVKKMDDFVSSLHSFNKLDFIKCDVEGAEKLVFEGGIETIKKYKPVIFSEMLRKWSKKFGYHPNDIIDFFKVIGYECYIIKKNKIKKFGCVDDKTIQTMFLFFHKEKHKDIVKKLLQRPMLQ